MIRLSPTPESRRRVQDHADRIRRLTRPRLDPDLAHVADAIRAGFAANFAAERQGSGQAWPPLAPSTVAERRRLGYPGEHPILVRSGDYRRSFVDPSSSDHAARVGYFFDGSAQLEIGSSDYRVAWLEYGTGRIPPRPVLELDARAERAVGDRLDDWATATLEE